MTDNSNESDKPLREDEEQLTRRVMKRVWELLQEDLRIERERRAR